MKREYYPINTESLLLMMRDSGHGKMQEFCKECGVKYDTFLRALSEQKMKLKDIMKISIVLGVYPYKVIYGKDSNHEYWYLSESDYPVDPKYCEHCKHWSKFYKWCCYLEETGKLKPDRSIVVQDDGRHICVCRELGVHERRKTMPN